MEGHAEPKTHFKTLFARPEMLNGVNLLGFWQGPRTILVGVGVALLNSSPPCLFLISGHFFMTAVFAPETLEL